MTEAEKSTLNIFGVIIFRAEWVAIRVGLKWKVCIGQITRESNPIGSDQISLLSEKNQITQHQGTA